MVREGEGFSAAPNLSSRRLSEALKCGQALCCCETTFKKVVHSIPFMKRKKEER